jgi:hypothetical protein
VLLIVPSAQQATTTVHSLLSWPAPCLLPLLLLLLSRLLPLLSMVRMTLPLTCLPSSAAIPWGSWSKGNLQGVNSTAAVTSPAI